MLIESLKMRWLVVVGFVALAVVGVVPNFADKALDTERDRNSFMLKNRVTKGLDIQGGLQLVMGVDTRAIMVEKTMRLLTELKDSFDFAKLSHGELRVDPQNALQLLVGFGAGDDEPALREHIESRDYFGVRLQVLELVEGSADAGGGRAFKVGFVPSTLDAYRAQVVDQAIEVVRARIDEFGVAEPSIAAQGNDRILVQLPGIKDTAGAKELVNRAARLNFRPVSKEVEPEQLAEWMEEAASKGVEFKETKGGGYRAYVEQLNQYLKPKLPLNTRVLFEKNDKAQDMLTGRVPHLIEVNNQLGGEHLEDAIAAPDEFGRYEVNFRFTPEGRRLFAELTEAIAPGFMAIVLDGVVKSAPSVREKIDSQRARITLGASNYEQTRKEAQFIASALRSGSLPADLSQLEERTVGPTLGAEAIAAGELAGVVGMVLVLVFMLFYYGAVGLVADLALVLNVLFIFGILSSLGATLTLPGVAGIILTVGMAVDANVIVFERIKEELRKGAGVGGAVADGFGQAFSAILDANITTALVCLVLMYYGTGPIRGFAVTLLCGIATSVFTAVFVSRTIIESLVHKFKFKNLVRV